MSDLLDELTEKVEEYESLLDNLHRNRKELETERNEVEAGEAMLDDDKQTIRKLAKEIREMLKQAVKENKDEKAKIIQLGARLIAEATKHG